ncbi:MAG TPA: hypothetical protein VH500_08350 [Nitrososphaeraceae archaeon]|jgi:hypothetical protein
MNVAKAGGKSVWFNNPNDTGATWEWIIYTKVNNKGRDVIAQISISSINGMEDNARATAYILNFETDSGPGATSNYVGSLTIPSCRWVQFSIWAIGPIEVFANILILAAT